MAVAAFDGESALHIHAERRAVQRLLDVMDSEGVARKHHVDVALPDEIAEVRAAARVDDDRTGDEGDALAGPPRRPHHRRDPRHADLDAALRRNLVRHEREAEPVAGLELRDDFHALDPADHGVSGANLPQLAADRAFIRDHDDGVHALALDCNPLPGDPHGRLMVRRRVEVFRRAPVAIGGDEMRVLGPGDAAAQRHQLLEEVAQHVGALRRDAHRHVRRFVVRAPDPEREHIERRVVADNGVPHRAQKLRVDEVPFGFDDFGDGFFRSHAASRKTRKAITRFRMMA